MPRLVLPAAAIWLKKAPFVILSVIGGDCKTVAAYEVEESRAYARRGVIAIAVLFAAEGKALGGTRLMLAEKQAAENSAACFKT